MSKSSYCAVWLLCKCRHTAGLRNSHVFALIYRPMWKAMESFAYFLSIIELGPSSPRSTGCLVSVRGDWAILCNSIGMWSARGKTFWILRHGRELNPGHGEDRQWDTFILPLSYHDPGHREDRQWDTFILPLSYHDPGHEEDRQHSIDVILTWELEGLISPISW